MLNIIDRFGEDVQTAIVDSEHFSAKVTVRPSSTFFSWVFQFCGGISITEPTEIVNAYRSMLEQAMKELHGYQTHNKQIRTITARICLYFYSGKANFGVFIQIEK